MRLRGFAVPSRSRKYARRAGVVSDGVQSHSHGARGHRDLPLENRPKKYARHTLALQRKPLQDVFAARAATGLRHLKPLQDIGTARACVASKDIRDNSQGTRGHGASPCETTPGDLHGAR